MYGPRRPLDGPTDAEFAEGEQRSFKTVTLSGILQVIAVKSIMRPDGEVLVGDGPLRLCCHWDSNPVPAVDVLLGSFFVIGHSGRAYEVSSLPVVVGPARGCSSYWPMPFGAYARSR
jgi:Protein of unknown function (DUF2961)